VTTALNNAQETLDRQLELSKTCAASKQAADNAQATRDAAAAQLESTKQAYALAVEEPRAEDIALARAELGAAQAKVAQAARPLIHGQRNQHHARSPRDTPRHQQALSGCGEPRTTLDQRCDPRRQNLRARRGEWRRQIDRFQDAVWPARTEFRPGQGGRARSSIRPRYSPRAHRLHGAEIFALRGSERAAES
jgi:hypothetical protein